VRIRQLANQLINGTIEEAVKECGGQQITSEAKNIETRSIENLDWENWMVKLRTVDTCKNRQKGY
jgi:hypothetical protein